MIADISRYPCLSVYISGPSAAEIWFRVQSNVSRYPFAVVIPLQVAIERKRGRTTDPASPFEMEYSIPTNIDRESLQRSITFAIGQIVRDLPLLNVQRHIPDHLASLLETGKV